MCLMRKFFLIIIMDCMWNVDYVSLDYVCAITIRKWRSTWRWWKIIIIFNEILVVSWFCHPDEMSALFIYTHLRDRRSSTNALMQINSTKIHRLNETQSNDLCSRNFLNLNCLDSSVKYIWNPGAYLFSITWLLYRITLYSIRKKSIILCIFCKFVCSTRVLECVLWPKTTIRTFGPCVFTCRTFLRNELPNWSKISILNKHADAQRAHEKRWNGRRNEKLQTYHIDAVWNA